VAGVSAKATVNRRPPTEIVSTVGFARSPVRTIVVSGVEVVGEPAGVAAVVTGTVAVGAGEVSVMTVPP
jgi:hypothetical protein